MTQTRTDIGLEKAPILKTITPAQQCKIDGGTWDSDNQVCLKFSKEEVEKEAPRVEATTPETFTDPKTGRASGITLPGGKTFLGLGPNDVDEVAAQQAGIVSRPEGTSPVGTAQQQADEKFRIQQQISKIGKVGPLTPAQQAEINYSQALTAGTIGQVPSILGTAGTFAAGGAIAGGPVGAAIGAGVGLIAGVARGMLGNIKEQQRGELQAADIELTNARTNMRQLAMLASQDSANADIYINQYNQQLTRIYQARRQTAAEVAGDLNAFMEDGREQLADFDAFLQTGGIADVYGQKLSIALNSGTPLSFDGAELMNLE